MSALGDLNREFGEFKDACVTRFNERAKLTGAAFTGAVTGPSFATTGALGYLGLTDRSTERAFQLYANNDVVHLYDATRNIFSVQRSGGMFLNTPLPTFTMYDTDLTTQKGAAVRFDQFYSSAGSFYQFLEGGGFKVLVSDAAGGAFSSYRTLLEVFTNTAGRTDDTGAFFPNGGAAIGEDGYAIWRTNVFEIHSTNTLHTADHPDTVSYTVSDGGITAVTIESGYAGYTASLDPENNPAHRLAENRVAAQGVGRSGVAYTNFEGYFATDSSGETTGDVYVVEPGEQYVDGSVIVVASPPPNSTMLDVGPQINLTRDAEAAASSVLGSIVWQGRSEGSSVVDLNWGQIFFQVQDPDNEDPIGRFGIATASASAGAGSATRWWINSQFYAAGLSEPGVEGAINAKGYYLNNVSLFDGSWTWTGNQTFTGGQLILRSSDDGSTIQPHLVLDRASASPAASDNLASIYFRGRDSGGAATDYAQVRGTIIDQTDTTEDGRLDFMTLVGGAAANRVHVQAGLRMSTIAADPGAGNIAATAYYVGSGTGPRILSGSGAPESAVSAPVGSLYVRTDGGTSTTLYVKETGSGNTGWIAK